MHKITGRKKGNMHYAFNSVSKNILQKAVAWPSMLTAQAGHSSSPSLRVSLNASYTDTFAHAHTRTHYFLIEVKVTKHN